MTSKSHSEINCPLQTLPVSNLCEAETIWIGDGICDDMSNNQYCQFDGGDCCLDFIIAVGK